MTFQIVWMTERLPAQFTDVLTNIEMNLLNMLRQISFACESQCALSTWNSFFIQMLFEMCGQRTLMREYLKFVRLNL